MHGDQHELASCAERTSGGRRPRADTGVVLTHHFAVLKCAQIADPPAQNKLNKAKERLSANDEAQLAKLGYKQVCSWCGLWAL